MNLHCGFPRIIAELTFIRQVNNTEPSFMMIVFSPYYHFCFCYHISFTMYAVLLFFPSYQFAVRLTEKSCHLSTYMYLITLHSRWVQEYTTAVKVRNISMHIIPTNDGLINNQRKPIKKSLLKTHHAQSPKYKTPLLFPEQK